MLFAEPAQAADPRIAVNPDAPPWNAIAKIQTNTGLRCTGVLVAPTVVLTAAHCLYNRRTRAMLQPVSLHVLFGYERAGYRWHGGVVRITTGAGFDGAKRPPQGGDWARLDLAETPPAAPLPFYEGPVAPGTSAMLAGYNQDRAQLLVGDLDCRILRGAAPYLVHDCAGTRGTSGAPLLVRQHGGWAVLGINIAAGPDANLAVRPAAASQAAKP